MEKIDTYELPAYTLSQFTKTRISAEHPEIQKFPLIVLAVTKVSKANVWFYPHHSSSPLQDNKLFKILCFHPYDILLLLLRSIYTSSPTVPGTVGALSLNQLLQF